MMTTIIVWEGGKGMKGEFGPSVITIMFHCQPEDRGRIKDEV
jgi:hypothetical protein